MMKFTIIAPFYSDPANVGNNRINRFINWINELELELVIIAIGERDEIVKENDRTIIYRANKLLRLLNQIKNIKISLLKKILFIPTKYLLSILLIPDMNMYWVKRIIRDNRIVNYIDGTKYILATSPLESALVLGYELSKMTHSKFIADFRDGWTIEPLNQITKLIPMRLRLEEKIEKKILLASQIILVTSNKWKELITEKYSFLENKVSVITNAYPEIEKHNHFSKKVELDKISLIYAGRLSGSSHRRNAGLILSPLFNFCEQKSIGLKIDFFGEFHGKDRKELNYWKEKYESIGSEIFIGNQIKKSELFKKIEVVNGLLLVSASMAAIPSKFFEYIIFEKPILVSAPINSEIRRVSQKLKQAYVLNAQNIESNEAIDKFMNHCTNPEKYEITIPREYENSYIRENFINLIDQHLLQ